MANEIYVVSRQMLWKLGDEIESCGGFGMLSLSRDKSSDDTLVLTLPRVHVPFITTKLHGLNIKPLCAISVLVITRPVFHII
jgi:hypothetical protein